MGLNSTRGALTMAAFLLTTQTFAQTKTDLIEKGPYDQRYFARVVGNPFVAKVPELLRRPPVPSTWTKHPARRTN
jgi:hypothetical protein